MEERNLLTGNIGEQHCYVYIIHDQFHIYIYSDDIFLWLSTYYTPDGNFEQNPFTGVFGIAFLFFTEYQCFSFFLSNLMYVNAGLMYYDSRTDLHQKVELKK
jgi:hypothetical protein